MEQLILSAIKEYVWDTRRSGLTINSWKMGPFMANLISLYDMVTCPVGKQKAMETLVKPLTLSFPAFFWKSWQPGAFA